MTRDEIREMTVAAREELLRNKLNIDIDAPDVFGSLIANYLYELMDAGYVIRFEAEQDEHYAYKVSVGDYSDSLITWPLALMNAAIFALYGVEE